MNNGKRAVILGYIAGAAFVVAAMLCVLWNPFGEYYIQRGRRLPPGYSIVTDGCRYTLRQPTGGLWVTSTWATKAGAAHMAWSVYLYPSQTTVEITDESLWSDIIEKAAEGV